MGFKVGHLVELGKPGGPNHETNQIAEINNPKKIILEKPLEFDHPAGDLLRVRIQLPTPGPTPSPTPGPTPSPTPRPTSGPTPSPTPSPTHDPTPSPTYDPTPSPTYD